MELLFAILIVVLVAAYVSVPLRGRREEAEAGVEDPVLAELEARKQAKYREIRDSELDHAQGKLGDEEFARQDAELRAEAIEILRRIDAAGAERDPEGGETARGSG
jgi:flagellar biosynthesis/type III secretory pathway M-ring protein FliF/YscJ